MIFLNFLTAACLLAIGVIGFLSTTDPLQIRALAYPGIFFGGAVLVCTLYARKEPRHGLAGASFLVFVAFLSNVGTLFSNLRRGNIDWSSPAPGLTTAICVVTGLYLVAALFLWKRARRLKAIAELKSE